MNTINKNIYNEILPSGIEQVPGWQSYSPVFKQLIEQVKPKVIIEVGTWLGASAINMAKITKELNLNTKIYCVDTWLGAEEFWTHNKHTPERDLKLKNGYPQIYFDFISNVKQHNVEDIITPIPNTSYIGSLILKHYNIAADLIYIDGSHEYIDVKNDINTYMQILNPGGIMFGDDYVDCWPGVRRAVKETLTNNFQVLENIFWVHRNGG
jgi:hypothetical protein